LIFNVKEYWQIAKNFWQLHLAYRGRIAVWVIVDLVSFIVFPFIWLAIFGDRQMIIGYTRADIVTYYIIVAIISLVFSSHIYLIVNRDIVNGELNSILTRPINYLLYRFTHEWTYKSLELVFAVILFLAMLVCAPQYLVVPKQFFTWVLFVLAGVLSLVMSFCIQMMVGLASFWLGEVRSLLQLRLFIEKLFSGELAPLTFFPVAFQVLATWLPFKYFVYFPAQIFLGKVGGWNLLYGFLYAVGWTVLLIGLTVVVWRRGLKQYDGSSI